MSWANYYQAKIPAGASIQDMLAAARRIVATCARPPIALDARWKPSQVVDLAAFAGRIAAIEPAGERIVDAELMPADPQALLDILVDLGHRQGYLDAALQRADRISCGFRRCHFRHFLSTN